MKVKKIISAIAALAMAASAFVALPMTADAASTVIYTQNFDSFTEANGDVISLADNTFTNDSHWSKTAYADNKSAAPKMEVVNDTDKKLAVVGNSGGGWGSSVLFTYPTVAGEAGIYTLNFDYNAYYENSTSGTVGMVMQLKTASDISADALNSSNTSYSLTRVSFVRNGNVQYGPSNTVSPATVSYTNYGTGSANITVIYNTETGAWSAKVDGTEVTSGTSDELIGASDIYLGFGSNNGWQRINNFTVSYEKTSASSVVYTQNFESFTEENGANIALTDNKIFTNDSHWSYTEYGQNNVQAPYMEIVNGDHKLAVASNSPCTNDKWGSSVLFTYPTVANEMGVYTLNFDYNGYYGDSVAGMVMELKTASDVNNDTSSTTYHSVSRVVIYRNGTVKYGDDVKSSATVTAGSANMTVVYNTETGAWSMYIGSTEAASGTCAGLVGASDIYLGFGSSNGWQRINNFTVSYEKTADKPEPVAEPVTASTAISGINADGVTYKVGLEFAEALNPSSYKNIVFQAGTGEEAVQRGGKVSDVIGSIDGDTIIAIILDHSPSRDVSVKFTNEAVTFVE